MRFIIDEERGAYLEEGDKILCLNVLEAHALCLKMRQLREEDLLETTSNLFVYKNILLAAIVELAKDHNKLKFYLDNF